MMEETPDRQMFTLLLLSWGHNRESVAVNEQNFPSVLIPV